MRSGLGVDFGHAIVYIGGASRVLSNAVTEVFTLISFRGEAIDASLPRFLAGATTATTAAIAPAARHSCGCCSRICQICQIFSRCAP